MTNPIDEIEVKQPKLLSYCSALYDKMLTEATVELIDDKEEIVWRGFVTHAAKQVGIPDGVYKRVTDQLGNMDCIEQIERGYRGHRSTTIILHRPPTRDVWQDERNFLGSDLTRRRDPAIIDRRVGELEKQLKGVNVIDALAELQQQIDDLRTAIHNKER